LLGRLDKKIGLFGGFFDAPAGGFEISGIQLDADEPAPHLGASDTRGAYSHEGIQNHVALHGTAEAHSAHHEGDGLLAGVRGGLDPRHQPQVTVRLL
jgi:hypothetical protein